MKYQIERIAKFRHLSKQCFTCVINSRISKCHKSNLRRLLKKKRRKEKRNVHLGSYSQILGKEAGGISKQEMSGVLFSMGTDAYGQLGLDVITNSDQHVNVKVLFPRMVISLRDEIIKEICCGHSHTLVINIYG